MSRLFTLNIPFEGEICAALVGLRDNGHDLRFSVHYLNQEVSRLLPQRYLEFSLIEGVTEPRDFSNVDALSLISSTVDAITTYLGMV